MVFIENSSLLTLTHVFLLRGTTERKPFVAVYNHKQLSVDASAENPRHILNRSKIILCTIYLSVCFILRIVIAAPLNAEHWKLAGCWSLEAATTQMFVFPSHWNTMRTDLTLWRCRWRRRLSRQHSGSCRWRRFSSTRGSDRRHRGRCSWLAHL